METTTLYLSKLVPVYLVYLTAFVDEKNRISGFAARVDCQIRALNKADHKTDDFYVMSGYRTPSYNRAIGVVVYSLSRPMVIFVVNEFKTI